MNKLFTKIVGAALGLTMAVGVGTAVAVNSKEPNRVEASSSSSSAPTGATYSHVFSTGQLAVTATGTATLSNITWNTTCANTSAYVGYDSGKGIQLGSGTAGKTIQDGYTISTAVSSFGSGKKVTKMAIGMSNAKSGGYSGTFPNSDTWSGTETSVTYYTSTAMNITSGDITFSFQSTAQKAVYIKAIYVWYENATEKTLSSIAVSGSMTKTSYRTTDSWDPTGLTVTATYSDSSTDDVTSSASWSYNPSSPSSISTTSVVASATYTEGGIEKSADSTSQSVSVTNKGTGDNPYTVTEAYDIASDLESGKNNGEVVYVTGVVSGTVTVTSGRGTFDIIDGDNTVKAYSITGVTNEDPSLSTYVGDGYTVVITGVIINYSGTYEVGFASGFTTSLVSSVAPKTVSSIAVKTPPTKTAYKSGENFNPSGLVITATYSDSTSEDIAYSSSPASFSFSPSVITSAGNVEISYRGATCNQAVSLITVTNVTGVASAPSEVYQNGSIQGSDVTLNVTYSDSTTGTVLADSVSVDTTTIADNVLATATYNAASGTKTATFYVDVVKEPVLVEIEDNIVSSDLTAIDTSYASFTNVSKLSPAVYAGNTSLQTTSIGFRSATSSGSNIHSGIVSTTTGGQIYKVTVTDYDHATRILDVYGSNTSYSSADDLYNTSTSGTKLGELTQSSQTLTISGDYSYIGVRSHDGLIKVSSIKFTWKVAGTDNPMTANPILSLGKSSINVGHHTTLSIETIPSDSDEALLVTSSDEAVATVEGSGKSYVVRGLSVGSSVITVKGLQSNYQSTITINVAAAAKTYEDKILTPDELGLTNSYDTDPTTKTFENVPYVECNVMKSGGFQFKKEAAGYLYNNDYLYGTSDIKSITLFMGSSNTDTPKVYQGSSSNPSTQVSVSGTFDETGVNTYIFSSGSAYFKIASGLHATHIERIVIELVDDADSVLEEARLGALAILTDLSGLCGTSGTGDVSPSDWATLKSDLEELDLSSDAKLLLKEADRIEIGNLSQGGAEIENAMAHYDNCISKWGYTDYFGISSASHVAPTTILSNVTTEDTIAVIVVISLVSVTAIGGYFFLRKRKEQ